MNGNNRNYYGGGGGGGQYPRQRLGYPGGGGKRNASPTERLAAALCHISLAANLFTWVGGIAFCLLCYLFAMGRAEYLTRQAGKALVAQLVVWGLIAPAWFLQLLIPGWVGGIFFWPWYVLVWFVAVLLEMFKAVLCL